MRHDGTFDFTAALWMLCAGSAPPLELICEMLFSVIGWCKAAGEGNFFSAQGCRFQLACFYAAEVFFQLNAGPELAKDLYFMKVKETVFPFYLWCDFFTRLGLQQPLY